MIVAVDARVAEGGERTLPLCRLHAEGQLQLAAADGAVTLLKHALRRLDIHAQGLGHVPLYLCGAVDRAVDHHVEPLVQQFLYEPARGAVIVAGKLGRLDQVAGLLQRVPAFEIIEIKADAVLFPLFHLARRDRHDGDNVLPRGKDRRGDIAQTRAGRAGENDQLFIHRTLTSLSE